MTWPFSQRGLGDTPYELIPRRPSSASGVQVTSDTALRHSAVWACRRLRADLVSMMPVNAFRKIDGYDVEVQKPQIFITPGGEEVLWSEWAYSTTDDLDSQGNTVGIIRQMVQNRPTLIELVPLEKVSAKGSGPTITEWKMYGEKVDTKYVWHERQFTRSGLAWGLSPIAYAAMQIGGYLNAQQFASDWFAGGGIPSARLKNVQKIVPPEDAQKIKDRFKATVGTGDIFVHGADWEYETIQAKASESAFIEQMQFSITDICRFLGVPADMIDAETSSGSITYANVTQRNLQLLILNLNPMLQRREETFSYRLVQQPRSVKFNRGVLLEMDLKSRYESYQIATAGAPWMTASEVRLIEDRPPFTPDQQAEIAAMKKAPTNGVSA